MTHIKDTARDVNSLDMHRVGVGVSGHSKFERPFVQASYTSNFETNAAVNCINNECALQV